MSTEPESQITVDSVRAALRQGLFQMGFDAGHLDVAMNMGLTEEVAANNRAEAQRLRDAGHMLQIFGVNAGLITADEMNDWQEWFRADRESGGFAIIEKYMEAA